MAISSTTGSTPPEQSASCIIAKAATGSHTLTIDGYSQMIKESHDHRKWVKSATFTVGGHTWCIEFLHDLPVFGACWIFIVLRLRCSCTKCSDGDGTNEVSAAYTFSFLGDHDGQQLSYYTESGREVCMFTRTMSAGITMPESRVATYRDGGDRLIIRCDITVYAEPRCEAQDVPSRLIDVPPPDIGGQLGRLLSSGFGADLTFEVTGGETYAVHRCILNARSPVLLEEISAAAATSCKQISGVEARVFQALFYYIYTDSLPEVGEGEAVEDMARHLIAAADRYSLDRLKLICEERLSRRVDT